MPPSDHVWLPAILVCWLQGSLMILGGWFARSSAQGWYPHLTVLLHPRYGFNECISWVLSCDLLIFWRTQTKACGLSCLSPGSSSLSRSYSVRPHAYIQDPLTDSELRFADSRDRHQNLPTYQGQILCSLTLVFRILQVCLFSMAKIYVVFIYFSIRDDFLLRSSSYFVREPAMLEQASIPADFAKNASNSEPSSIPVIPFSLITFHSLSSNHFLCLYFVIQLRFSFMN